MSCLEEGRDAYWMQQALILAGLARDKSEVPVGAIIVLDGEIIGAGSNQPIATHDPTAHAEVVAIRDAGSRIRNYRLVNAVLYSTLEPCVMCMGAITQARIKRLVFGAADPVRGAAGSILDLCNTSFLNHRLECIGGVCAEEASTLLRDFFHQRRRNDGNDQVEAAI